MKRLREVLFVGLIGLAFIVSLYGILHLPERVPIHFDSSGRPDSYGSKWILLVNPLIAALVYFGIPFLMKIDPYSEKITPRKMTVMIIRDALTLFISFMAVISVWAAYIGKLPTGIVEIMVSSLFVILGNYLPKLPPNWFVGIRTPWTLLSERVWKKTHSAVGILMFLVGLVMLVSAILSPKIWIFITIASAILLVVVSFTYSYYLYNHQP